MLDLARWWAENRFVEQAFAWLEGFEQALASLANNPERCAIARESDAFDFDMHQLHYGLRTKPTHRAVFEIRGQDAIVHAIRHLAQRDLTSDDL